MPAPRGPHPGLADRSGWRRALSSPAKALLLQISDLYVAYFNRAPDVPGILYWFRNVSSGEWRLDDVASSFTDQVEYQPAYPPGSATATSSKASMPTCSIACPTRKAGTTGSTTWITAARATYSS